MNKYQKESLKLIDKMLTEVFGPIDFNKKPKTVKIIKQSVPIKGWTIGPICNNNPCHCGDGDDEGYDYF